MLNLGTLSIRRCASFLGMDHILCKAALMFLGAGVMAAPMRGAEPEVIKLWESEIPGALGTADQDVPTLTLYPAGTEKNQGGAVVVFPGGGYGGLAGHEGKDYALWLNQQGITAFVLKYRLGSHGYRHPRMLEDAARSVRWVRAHADRWKLAPGKLGIMGSSAGGHLASTLLTHFDGGNATSADPVERQSSRPDFGILCYPVISMGPLTHQGSKNNLLGSNPSPDLVRLLSNELQVTPQTPPCFIFHTVQDQAVKVENALEFASALQKNGVMYDLHIYEKGGHGMGLGDKPPFANTHPWVKDLSFWLKQRGVSQ